jgi:hypothetical protein
MQVDTIVFDVIGTVVDEASIAEDLALVLEADVAEAIGTALGRGHGPAAGREALHEVLPDAARLDPDELAWLDDLSVDDLGALGLRLLDGQGQASPGV